MSMLELQALDRIESRLDDLAAQLDDLAVQLNGRLDQLLKAREDVAYTAGQKQEADEENMRRIREYTDGDGP